MSGGLGRIVPGGLLGVIAAGLIGILFWPTAARASGDIGCSPAWKLRHHDFTGCDSMVMLSPGNDTRVNLVLLLARSIAAVPAAPHDARRLDTRPEPLFDWSAFEAYLSAAAPDVGDDDHAAGEGSRCLSDAAGKAAFAAALNAARGVTATEKATLIAARDGLKPTCTNADQAAATAAAAQVSSVAGRGFAVYLQAAAAFYAGDFDTAVARFASLDRSGEPWLRETARYMLGRVEVNRAQVGLFDEYGARDEQSHADPKTIAAADAGLRAYLAAYPAGRYATSARGLLRRVYWLADDRAKLAAQYAALFAQPAGTRGLDDAALAEEIDNKLLPHLTVADTTDPILLAVLDLQAMRGDDAKPATPLIGHADLEAQRARFARQPALFEFLLAAHSFYVGSDPREVLRLIADAARQPSFDPVPFSRQMLRGMALDAIGDRNARGFWLDLMPGATPPLQRPSVELALAFHDERTAGLDRVFAAGSPVHDATIRDLLLTNVAGAALLRRQASDAGVGKHERGVALFTLLYKDITRGAYRDFVSDVARVPPGADGKTNIYKFVGTNDPSLGVFVAGVTKEGFVCPTLRETAARLAADPHVAAARLCVAEFLRLNNMDGYFLDTPPSADELGGTRSLFPGRPFSRLEVYKTLIAAPATPAPDRAYALFRAVNCYAPSRANGCGGEDVAPAVRKGWFMRLHKDYPASRWAQELRYYW